MFCMTCKGLFSHFTWAIFFFLQNEQYAEYGSFDNSLTQAAKSGLTFLSDQSGLHADFETHFNS